MTENSIRLLDDEVVYRRTSNGQAELLSAPARLSKLELRFLGAVTGYTPLRVLVDLGKYESEIASAVTHLAAQHLTERANLDE
jgi:hypothetical protein